MNYIAKPIIAAFMQVASLNASGPFQPSSIERQGHKQEHVNACIESANAMHAYRNAIVDVGAAITEQLKAGDPVDSEMQDSIEEFFASAEQFDKDLGGERRSCPDIVFPSPFFDDLPNAEVKENTSERQSCNKGAELLRQQRKLTEEAEVFVENTRAKLKGLIESGRADSVEITVNGKKGSVSKFLHDYEMYARSLRSEFNNDLLKEIIVCPDTLHPHPYRSPLPKPDSTQKRTP